MAISFVAKSAFASGTAGLTVGAVSGVQSGDLILLFVESANQAVTTPSGYSVVTGAQVSAGTAGAAGGMLLNVFYKWATGTDTTTSVTDTGDHTTAIKLAYRGVDSTTPFDATPTTGTKTTASTSSTYPAITTATANALVIHASALDLDTASTATTSAQSNANLTSLTERHDQTVASGFGGGIVITDGFKATAGSSGTMSATVTNTQQVYITLALRPQGAVTHAATGALVGQGSTIAGTARKNVPHASTGALVGSGSTVAGTAQIVGLQPIRISTTLWEQDTLGTSGAPGAKAITVPADAQAVVVQAHSTMNANPPSLSITSDFAGTFTVINSAHQDGCSIGYALVTSTGSKNLTLAWTEGILEGPSVYISFIKNINTSDWVREAAAVSTGTDGNTVSNVFDTGTNDLLLVVDEQDGSNGIPTTISGFTSIATDSGTYGSGSRIQSCNAPGSATTTVTSVSTKYATLSGISIKPGSAGPVTHAASGALVGSGSTVSGSAQHLALHTSTGALVGQGSTVTGSANRFRAHDSSGSLVGQGSTVTGSASRSAGAVTHDATGSLVGQGSVVAGIAARWRAFSSSGTLVGQGAVLVGTANRTHVHAATGALVGAGAVVAGAAARTRVHTATGALVGSGSTVTGSAQHNVPHTSSGALVGSGSTITGAASRNTTAVSHDATGTLIGQGSVLSGAAARTRQHEATGALVGQGAILSGSASRTRVHTATGALVGSGSTVTGAAYRATPGVPVWPLPSQVLAGVVYGPTGIEYVGTLDAGNSGIQYDIVTGQLVMPLANPILMTL